MKRICFFLGDMTRCGGTEKAAAQVASEMANMGNQYDITILSLMEAEEKPFFAIPDTIHRVAILSKIISPINRAILQYPYITYWLVRFIKRNGIDVIIDVDGVLDIFSLSAKLFTRVKVITWEHFNFYENLGSRYRLWMKKLSARFSDYFVVLTKEDKKNFQKNLNLRCPIEYIYNPQNMDGNASYNRASKMILSVGRLDRIKGFDMLIDVARIVFAKHGNWSWMIAGSGEEKEKLEHKIREYGLDRHIHFVGNVKDMEGLYGKSGIFVLTSRSEGFGLVIAEAKRFHLPVVSFDCKAGPKELVLHRQNGFLIPCFDLEDMAEKINLLIEDEQLRVRFSDHACNDTEKFSFPAVMQKWAKVLDSL